MPKSAEDESGGVGPLPRISDERDSGLEGPTHEREASPIETIARAALAWASGGVP